VHRLLIAAFSATVLALVSLTAPASSMSTAAIAALSESDAEQLAAESWTAHRVSGTNRYETAAEVAKNWPTSVPIAYVVTGQDFPDALAASAKAGAVNAPVLLTAPSTMPEATSKALKRLRPGRIVVVGGTASVSAKVFDSLRHHARSGRVQRINGSNRYSTAAEVAGDYPKNPDRVYLASGEAFPDALAASSLAGSQKVALLLTRRGSIDQSTLAQLQRIDPKEVVIVGGPGAVSSRVARQVATTTRSVRRLAGADRYRTAARIADDFPTDAAPAYVASGEQFPDALVGSSLAAQQDVALILTPAERLHPSTLRSLARRSRTSMVVLGGRAAIRASTVTSLARAAGGRSDADEGIPADPLWMSDYDSGAVTAAKTPYASQLGVRQTYDPAAAWQGVQNVRSPGWSSAGANGRGRLSPKRFERMQVIDAESVPGRGAYKPSGRAMRYELRPWEDGFGDVFVSSGYATNRAETYARHGRSDKAARTWPDPPGSQRWYSFSWAPSNDFAFAGEGNDIPDDEWSLIWQLKGKNAGSPPLGILLKRNTIMTAGSAVGWIPLGQVEGGAWTRLVIGVKHSSDPGQGWVEIWRDGVKVLPRTYGATVLKQSNGEIAGNYMKQGLYRSKDWGVKHVTYYGPTKVGQTRQSVME